MIKQTKLKQSSMLGNLLSLIPNLTKNRSKGDNCKLGVIGGNENYTGAPYFCSMAAFHSVILLYYKHDLA